MPAAFLHGVETIQVNAGSRPIQTVKTAVIGLVGTASKYTLADQSKWPDPNTPVLISNYADAVAYFGTEGLDSYTLAPALKAIFDQGGALCVVVNVLDPTANNANVSAESVTLDTTTDKVALAHAGVANGVVRSATDLVTNGTFASDTGWTKGTGWTIAAGVADCDGTQSAASDLAQNQACTQGRTYAVTYTITRSAGTLTPKIGGTAGTARIAAGTYTDVIICGAGADPKLEFEADADFVGTVDAVDCREQFIVATDYTLDAVTGEITRVRTGNIASGASLRVNYSWMDPAAITATDIVGTIVSGNRTGAQCFLDASNLLGIKPKILISPGYGSSSTTVAGFDVLANSLRAVWIGDVASGTTVANALLTRGVGGIFNTSSNRGIACYPYLKDSGGTLRPMSGYLAGAIAASDLNRGYWFSPSNVEFKGVSALERAVSFSPTDSTCDANTLNAQGISTAATGYGLGIRSWGNRNLSWPTSTLPQNFISILRTQDVLWESVEYATLQWIDQPINQATINGIKASVNGFIRELIGRGALIDGECTFDPAKNPPSQMANGQLVFDISFMPPPPAERITFNSLVDIDLLKKLR